MPFLILDAVSNDTSIKMSPVYVKTTYVRTLASVSSEMWRGSLARDRGELLTLRLLMSYIYIYGAPSKARNANVVYIWTYVWQR